MALPQVYTYTQNGNLYAKNIQPDGVSGFIAAGVGTANYTVGDVISVFSAKQLATQYLIDELYDTTNGLLIYHHVSEYFRMGGQKLWLQLVPAGTTMVAMLTPSNPNFAKKILQQANGEIIQLGVGKSGAAGALGAGLEADVLAAIPIAQQLADNEYSEFRPLVILLEGKGFNGTAASATDLRTLNSRNVSVVIAQDATQAALHANYGKYAAVGTVLGTIAKSQVHECIGYVGKFNIADIKKTKFLDPSLSSGLKINTYSAADLDILHDKGYIFGRTFAAYTGVYFSNSATCTYNTDDYKFIELMRVIQKAIRTTRIALLKYLLGPLLPDADTGRLDSKQKSLFELEVRQAISLNMSDSITEIYDVIVDPIFDENGVPYPGILIDNTIRVFISIVPQGKAERIEVYIGLINPNI